MSKNKFMGSNGINIVSILVVSAIVLALFFAIRSMRKRKGQCAYCDRKDSCPYKIKE